jgi:amino acid transporter
MPALSQVLSPAGVALLTLSALSPVMSVYIAGDALLHIAGTGAAMAVAIGGALSALVTLLYAELGAAFPRAGGLYPSLSAVLGRFITFPMVLLGVPIAIGTTAFTAVGLSDYVRVLVPGLPPLPIVFGGISLAALIAVLRVRTSAVITGVFLAVEAIALALLTAVAALHPARHLGEVLVHPVMFARGELISTPLAVIGLALVSGVWVTGGAGYALYFAEEMRAPRKVGRAIAWTAAVAAVVSALPIVLTVTSAPDLRAMLNAQTPIVAFLAQVGSPIVAAAVSAGVVAALFNSLTASVMGYSRYFYATGRDGLWPAPISRVLVTLHPRFCSPWAATLVVGVLAMMTSLLGERAILILISGDVSSYILMAIGVWISRPRGQTGRWFRAPLHPLIPLLSLAYGLFAIVMDWLDPDAGRPSTILLSSLFTLGLIYYRLRRIAG